MPEAKINLDKVLPGIVEKLIRGTSFDKWNIKHPDCSPITSVERVFDPTPGMQLEIKISKGGSRVEVEMQEKDEEHDCWKVTGLGETYLLSLDPNFQFFSQIFQKVRESYEKTHRVEEMRVNEKLADALK